MIEIAVVKIVRLCIASFSVGVSLCNLIYAVGLFKEFNNKGSKRNNKGGN